MELISILSLLALGLALVSSATCPNPREDQSLKKSMKARKKSVKKCAISRNHRAILQSAINEANKDSNLSAKVFARYLTAHPETKVMIPSLSLIAPDDLMNHKVFLTQSAACFEALNRFFSHQHFDKSRGCPYTTKTKGRYTSAQQLAFGRTLIETLKAELGDKMTGEMTNALNATVCVVQSAARHSRVHSL